MYVLSATKRQVSTLTGSIYLNQKIMFKRLLFIGFVFTSINSRAADEQKVASKVQKVIVFLNGAQVTRTAKTDISEGTSILLFENISPGIDAQSIQVHADGDFTILSVNNELNYLIATHQQNIDGLREQEKTIQDKIDLENGQLIVNQEEQTMLLKNQLVKGDNSNLDVAQLKQALDFQTSYLTAINTKQLTIRNEIAALNVQLQKYERQIADMNQGNNTLSSNILVTVSSKKATQADFTLSYLVHNASWFPTYDIRAKDVNSPLSITYKANVSQQSGEDWRNVKLTLSTGNPSAGNNKPELNPYYLNFNSANSNMLNEVVAVGYGRERKTEQSNYDKQLMSVAEIAEPPQVSLQENQTNVDFNIADLYSVPSDGKKYTVEINEVNLPASYEYVVAPKLSTDVFLSAKVVDWNKYNFLPGAVNLFFEGTFIGKSQLNTNSTADTLNISLGTDKSIVVTRTLQKQLTQRQTIGSNQKDTRDWLINIKNRKSQPISLLVEDQVPVSQNVAIEVENQQLSGGNLDTNTGKVAWNIALKPQADKKLELKYQVKYPKNQSVIID